MEKGHYKIIRVDGTEEVIDHRAQLDIIHGQIGCDCIDTVILTRDPVTRLAHDVMMVDDTGMIDGKPVNLKATELYHSVCIPGTMAEIHGDVAIVNDEDFA
jgi:hypothetical protein